MPSFPPRGNEPYKKRELFEKRLDALQGAVTAGASEERLVKAAALVRFAALGIIKARRAILKESLLAGPRTEAHDRQRMNLDRDEADWLARSDVEIVTQFVSGRLNTF